MFPFHDDNPTQRFPFVTIALIVINTAVFVWMLRQPEARQLHVMFQRGFVPARIAQLTTRQPIEAPVGPQVGVPQPEVGVPQSVRLPAAPGQIYLSLLTCMFLHGGWMHLLGNMWFLWLFGNNVEDRLGHILFLLLYLGGGLLATFCHWLPEPNSLVPVIGASGAVAAALGAYAITWPFARIKTLVFLVVFVTIVELPALLVLGFWFAMQLIEAATAIQFGMGGDVAWWAHVGGFVTGFVLMPLLSAMVYRPAPPPERMQWQEFT